jgi:hypothetical protein
VLSSLSLHPSIAHVPNLLPWQWGVPLACQILSPCQVRRRQLFGDVVAIVYRFGARLTGQLCCGEIVPYVGLNQILVYANAFPIHPPEGYLCIRVALVGTFWNHWAAAA